MKQRHLISFIILLSFGWMSSSSAQDIVIDQQVIESLLGTQTSGTLAQTFTVGVSGELDSVELLLRSDGSRTFDIRPTDATGIPSTDDESALFSTVLPGSSDQPFTYVVDVSAAAIHVNQGDVLAIVLSPADASTGIVRWASGSSTANPYAGGQGFTRNQNTGEFRAFFDTDYGFTTRVAVSDPVLLGDINLDGILDFFDISAFIEVLAGGGFQAEADCDEDGDIDFDDIRPFIVLLAS